MQHTRLTETAEEVSQIAFGFMASKALFAGLHIDVFTMLADGPKSSQDISANAGIPVNRVTTLMTALTSIGLVDREEKGEIYCNSPGADAFLARGAKYEFGDYLRFQIDKQMYPFLGQLNDVIDGSLDSDAIDSYQHWMADPDQALIYCRAQHAGSLGPGRTLARLVDLDNAQTLLDVGLDDDDPLAHLDERRPRLGEVLLLRREVRRLEEELVAVAVVALVEKLLGGLLREERTRVGGLDVEERAELLDLLLRDKLGDLVEAPESTARICRASCSITCGCGFSIACATANP